MLKPFLPCSSSTIVESIDIHTPSQLSHPSSPPASQLYPSSVIKHKPHAQSYTNLMTLASFGSPNRIELNHQALDVINAYSKWEVGFCGIISHSRKRSSVVSKLLEIPDESKRLTKSDTNYKGSLNISKIPYTINKSQRLFFLEYFRSSYRDQAQEQIVKILTMLCSSLILATDYRDGFEQIYRLLATCSKSIVNSNNREVWPRNCYLVNVGNEDRKFIRPISQLFSRTLPINSLQHQSLVVEELLANLAKSFSKKCYERLQVTPPVACKALIRLSDRKYNPKAANRSNITQVYEEIIRQLYEESYKYIIQLYDQTASQFFAEETAYSVDSVLEAFERVRRVVMAKFQVNLSDSMQEEYSMKLEEYIDQKERLILEVNKKKTKYMLKQELDGIRVTKRQISSQNGLQQIMHKLQKLASLYDHNSSETVSTFLYTLTLFLEKYLRKVIKKSQITSGPEQNKQLLQHLCDKRYELEVMEDQRQAQLIAHKQREKAYEELKQRRKQLKATLSRLRKEIQIAEISKESKIQSRRMLQQKSQKMLEVIRQLEERYRDNDEVLRGVKSELDFEPSIERMERRLSTLSKECDMLELKRQIISSNITGSNIQDYTFNQQ